VRPSRNTPARVASSAAAAAAKGSRRRGRLQRRHGGTPVPRRPRPGWRRIRSGAVDRGQLVLGRAERSGQRPGPEPTGRCCRSIAVGDLLASRAPAAIECRASTGVAAFLPHSRRNRSTWPIPEDRDLAGFSGAGGRPLSQTVKCHISDILRNRLLRFAGSLEPTPGLEPGTPSLRDAIPTCAGSGSFAGRYGLKRAVQAAVIPYPFRIRRVLASTTRSSGLSVRINAKPRRESCRNRRTA
jgi:hypothetical protein